MGALYQFTCSKCGYTAEVSGGSDYGMVSITRTITCTVCKELVDVEVGEIVMRENTSQEFERKVHECPNDQRHEARVWSCPSGCPKCGANMTQGPATILWD